MPQVRLFAAARDAAGTGRDVLAGATVGEVLDAAVARYGVAFGDVLATARVWVNGEPATLDQPVADADEVAVLPPVSGGAVGPGASPTKAGRRSSSPPSAPSAASAAPPTGTAGAGVQRPSSRSMAADPGMMVDRLFAPADTAGHKAVLGLAWVALQAVALVLGPFAVAVLFGLVGAVAGLHAARAWRRVRVWSSRAVAGLAPLLVPLAAAHSAGAAGVAVLIAVVASLIVAATSGNSRRSLLGSAGTTVRCWLAPAMAAASVVLVADVEVVAAATLLVLIAGYDVGAYLWGSAADGPLVGRITGIITVGVLAFALGVVQLVLELPPFQSMGAVLVFGGLVATLAPLGQLVASAILPAAAADAPALRRLDALLLAGPAWAFALWGYVA